MSFGCGYVGSPSIQTSIANENIIPSTDNFKYNLYKFEFMNQEDCTVIINELSDKPIFISGQQGFQMDMNDWMIFSFKIIEPNIHYNWIGAYA